MFSMEMTYVKSLEVRVQKSLLFTYPPAIDAVARPTASDWRNTFEDAGIGVRADWNDIRMDAGKHKLNLYSANQRGSRFLESNLDSVAGCVADALKAPVPFELADRMIGVYAGTDRLWAYRVPCLVVEKSGGGWQAHYEAELAADIKAKMVRIVEDSIRRELSGWGVLPDALRDGPFLALADPGRPVIFPAIAAPRSGHGAAVNVLARRDVKLMSYWRFEGRLFVGRLTSLGYGRVDRTPPPELLSLELQRALLKVTPESHEAH